MDRRGRKKSTAFYHGYFFGNHYGNSLKEYLGQSRFSQTSVFEELVIIILDETREAKLKVSDFLSYRI